MFQSFTGSSRRPRQVNMSGRGVTNPWATGTTPGGGASTMQNVHQDREKRKQERERLNATKLLQRAWRGHRCRQQLKDHYRAEWDAEEQHISGTGMLGASQPFDDELQALAQLRRLGRFANLRVLEDQQRLRHFLEHLKASIGGTTQRPNLNEPYSHEPWPDAYLSLQKHILSAIRTLSASKKGIVSSPDGALSLPDLLQYLVFTIQRSPRLSQDNSQNIYSALAKAVQFVAKLEEKELHRVSATIGQLLCQAATAPLQEINPNTWKVYEAMACEFLALEEWTTPPLLSLNWLQYLGEQDVNGLLLARAMVHNLSSSKFDGYEKMRSPEKRASLLATLIYLRESWKLSSTKDFLRVVSTLLSSISNDAIGFRRRTADDDEDENENSSTGFDIIRPGSFVHKEIMSLVDKENISGLLKGIAAAGSSSGNLDDKAKELASFALTLLRFFPQRGDDIRMWLYLGDTGNSDKITATQYFWEAARKTTVFGEILKSPNSALRLLKQSTTESANVLSADSSSRKNMPEQLEWTVVLVFFELYSFALKHTDDEEFFGSFNATKLAPSSPTWARRNALTRSEVESVIYFLKNLTFTMYFKTAQLSFSEDQSLPTGSLRNYFHVSSPIQPAEPVPTRREVTVAGIPGITMDHVKRLSTGLLRSLYERHSRRPDLLTVNWLMTDEFQMEGFIESVVAENDRRHEIEQEDAEDGIDPDDNQVIGSGVIGMSGVVRLREQQILRRQQRKQARIRQMQAVTPRLEILQNLPFFIPFETRVEIFREFIRLDMGKRRSVRPNNFDFFAGMPGRHHATISRDKIFEDAFEQFYPIHDGLKDPIQITFVDKWNQQEAGIDGGGVTKEFLTSITKEAFRPTDGSTPMFVENDQNLLYPNPTALEQLEYDLKQKGIPEGSEDFRKARHALLSRYEFLGRIVGKCLWEGILVDVTFAGFFLLKWALTGGAGLAPKESGYRANLNDLRELDRVLYDNLIQLKNYPGDVAEDFGVNFTIVDSIPTSNPPNSYVNITRDLKPGGANIPVTNENRLAYISYVARHRLQIQPAPQTSAFLRGLSTIISPSWLNMFNQNELQTLVGGTSSKINIEDLRSNTEYSGVYVIGDDGQEHHTVELFWRVLESMDEQDQRAVLKFVTSTPRAPLLGFKTLFPKFTIRDSGQDQSRLPSTSTCVNLLKLPMYTNEKTLREKLLLAVNSGAGFDLS